MVFWALRCTLVHHHVTWQFKITRTSYLYDILNNIGSYLKSIRDYIKELEFFHFCTPLRQSMSYMAIGVWFVLIQTKDRIISIGTLKVFWYLIKNWIIQFPFSFLFSPKPLSVSQLSKVNCKWSGPNSMAIFLFDLLPRGRHHHHLLYQWLWSIDIFQLLPTTYALLHALHTNTFKNGTRNWYP